MEGVGKGGEVEGNCRYSIDGGRETGRMKRMGNGVRCAWRSNMKEIRLLRTEEGSGVRNLDLD